MEIKETHKFCKSCFSIKPKDNFYTLKRGLDSKCKECKKIQNNKFYNNHKDYFKQYNENKKLRKREKKLSEITEIPIN